LLAAHSIKPDALLICACAGHPSKEALKIMFGVESSTLDCFSCRLFKSTLLPFSKTLPSPISVLCNNQASIALAKNPMFQQRTKHINVKFHCTCKMIEASKISVTYIQTSSMQADGLTKSLANPKHQELIGALKLAS
jgi:hypothetical protein